MSLAAAAMSAAAWAVPGPVDGPALQWNDSTSISVHLTLTAGGAEFRGNRRLVVTPSIVGQDGNSRALPQVEFAGRQNRKYNDRRALLAGEPARTGVYGMGDTVDYVQTVAVEPWMLATPLRLEVARDIEGCCDVVALSRDVRGTTTYVAPYVPVFDMVVPRLSVAEELAKHEPILKPMSDYRPYDNKIPLREMTGALYVHFPVNVTHLDESFRDNKATLDKIVRMLSAIKADTASHVRRVVIIGLASPEGPIDNNERLSEGRAAALRDYVVEHVSLDDVDYELVAGGEAWADLRVIVERSDIEHKDDVLAIIDGEDDPDRREALLRRYDGGKLFAYLTRQVFVDQRNAGYIQVYYDATPDVPAMKINEASDCIKQGDWQRAIDLIERLDDDRKWNTLGAAYYAAGRRDEAKQCFERAADLGDNDAWRNLREIERRERMQ